MGGSAGRSRRIFISTIVSLTELEVLVSVTEGFCKRRDIPEQVYYDLLTNQLKLQSSLQNNPNYYADQETRKRAMAINQQIVQCLDHRISILLQGKAA